MSSTQSRPQTHDDSSIDMDPPPPIFESPEDALPPYTNNLRMASLCRRKREFQAEFDKTRRGRRTWELVWLVLDGTALRLYKPEKEEKRTVENPDLGLARASSGDGTRSSSNVSLSAWLSCVRPERGDAPLNPPILTGVTRSLVSASEPHLQRIRSRDARSLADCPPPSTGGQAPPTGRHRMNSIAKATPINAPAHPSHPLAASYSTSTPFLNSASSGVLHPAFAAQPITAPDFSKRKASRQYHLQHAICMKADAYTKREHVLRFILEDGKQFLVQLSSRTETIAWLQLMSVAAPLSLDLDERPMPEPAYYPRRRPRTRAQRRPSTAPGALETGTRTPAATASGSPVMEATHGVSVVPYGRVDSVDGAGAVVADEEVIVEEEEVDIGEEMDHLPPPRRPVIIRSLSSVEQARRRGIQL